MNVYYNTTFTGHYPVGSAAIVVAPDQHTAADILNDHLMVMGLKGDAEPNYMILVDTTTEAACILVDGDC